MIVDNYANLRDNLKKYCDKVWDEKETLIISRKGAKNIVLMSLDEYNELIKAADNLAYLKELDESIEQDKAGKLTRMPEFEDDDEKDDD